MGVQTQTALLACYVSPFTTTLHTFIHTPGYKLTETCMLFWTKLTVHSKMRALFPSLDKNVA